MLIRGRREEVEAAIRVLRQHGTVEVLEWWVGAAHIAAARGDETKADTGYATILSCIADIVTNIAGAGLSVDRAKS